MDDIAKRNSSYAIAYYVVSLTLPIAIAPFVARVLGVTSVGEVAYAQSIFIFFQLLAGLGSGTYGQRLIAERSARMESISQVFFEIWLVKTILGLAGIVIFSLAIVILDLPLKLLLYVQIVDLAINFVDIAWLYQGKQNFKKVILCQLMSKLLTLVGVFSLIRAESDGFLYLLCFSVPTFLGCTMMWAGLRKQLDSAEFKKPALGSHFKGMIVLFLPYLAMLLFAHVDRILIGLITSDMAQVGFYDMAFRFVAIALGISTALSSALMPNLTGAHARGNSSYVKNALSKATEVILVFGSVVAMVMVAIAPALIPWFLGHGFLDSVKILQVLAGLSLIKGLTIVLGSGLMIALKYENQLIACIWVVLGVNILLNYLWIPYSGALGAAMASLASEIIFLILISFCLRSFLSSSILMGSLKCVSLILPILFFYSWFGFSIKPTFSSLTLNALVLGLAYLSLLFLIYRECYIFHFLKEFSISK